MAIDQRKSWKRPVGTFHLPSPGFLDPWQKCTSQSHNFFYKHLNLMHRAISKLVLNANTFLNPVKDDLSWLSWTMTMFNLIYSLVKFGMLNILGTWSYKYKKAHTNTNTSKYKNNHNSLVMSSNQEQTASALFLNRQQSSLVKIWSQQQIVGTTMSLIIDIKASSSLMSIV